MSKAKSVRNNLGNIWSFLDNYSKHNNGRIWVIWDDSEIKVKYMSYTAQLCGVYSLNDEFMVWCTVIFALNTLDKRRTFWKDIEKFHLHT